MFDQKWTGRLYIATVTLAFTVNNKPMLFVAGLDRPWSVGPVVRVRTRAFLVAAPTLWNSLPLSIKSVGNITTFCLELKTHLLINLLILHSSPAYQSNCLQLELITDYELLNPFCFGALQSLTPFVLVRSRA